VKPVPLRIVVIGDVGSTAAYHVGDEAMLAGLIEGIDGSGVCAHWTVISLDPASSSLNFGVDAVPDFGFVGCQDLAAREALLARLDALLAEKGTKWLAHAPAAWRETLGAIARSDAVVIAGGGNLADSWPGQIFERAALVRSAMRAGKPVVISGQTLGPTLSARSRQLATEVLTACALVGAREELSFGLARELGVNPDRLRLQFDDAIGVEAVAPAGAARIARRGEFIAVTLNPLPVTTDSTWMLPAIAQQLCTLAAHTEKTIVMVPHVGDLGGAKVHDVGVAHQLLEAAGRSPRLRIAPLPSPSEAVWYCENASMVVSTRYHPVVFAIATGTPALFLYQDRYTRVKGEGALRLAGLDGWSLSIGLGARGLLIQAAIDLWENQEAVRAHLREIKSVLRRARQQHVDALIGALQPQKSRLRRAASIPPQYGPSPLANWVNLAHDALAMFDGPANDALTHQQMELLDRRARTAEEFAGTLVREVARKDAELVTAQSALVKIWKKCEELESHRRADQEKLRQRELEEPASVAGESAPES
jgi:polysaccharide pyruvyl transferase WcaK-like protein